MIQGTSRDFVDVLSRREMLQKVMEHAIFTILQKDYEKHYEGRAENC